MSTINDSVSTKHTRHVRLGDHLCLPFASDVEQREVVLLVGLEEMSYADVALALDIPIGTVMSRLSRGRERLRALMAGSVPRANLKVVR